MIEALARIEKLKARALKRLADLRADRIDAIETAEDPAELEDAIEDISAEIAREHALLLALNDAAADLKRGADTVSVAA